MTTTTKRETGIAGWAAQMLNEWPQLSAQHPLEELHLQMNAVEIGRCRSTGQEL